MGSPLFFKPSLVQTVRVNCAHSPHNEALNQENSGILRRVKSALDHLKQGFVRITGTVCTKQYQQIIKN